MGYPMGRAPNPFANMAGPSHPFSAQQYHSSAADQLLGLQMLAARNTFTPPPAPATPKMRTQEEIIEQCKARLAEMEREAAELKAKEALPQCKDCRWAKHRSSANFIKCSQPLITGIEAKPKYVSSDMFGYTATLCGPEKALWEPRLSLITRIINWFTAPWRGY